MMRLPSYITENAGMAPYTTFRIGGPARWFAQPSTKAEVAETFAVAEELGTGVLVLGGGSNLLVSDAGVEAMVVRLGDGGEFAAIEAGAPETSFWRVGAAAPLQSLVSATVRAGMQGLESMAGIPGSVGGAVAMNAGGAESGIGSYVVSAEAYDLRGRARIVTPPELAFAYRASSLRGMLAVSFSFRFVETRDEDELLTCMREYRERKRATQPLQMPSAGCVFKNPPGDSAGGLLELAGCKGMREGGAEVSSIHANFIVNTGGASARDVLGLASRMREAVWRHSRVELELELAVWE